MFGWHRLPFCVALVTVLMGIQVVPAQQQLVTPQGGDGAPETIEDLLGVLDDAAAAPEWADTDVIFRPQPDQARSFAILSALDKIAALVTPLAIGIGESANFGTLTITVRSCQASEDTRARENAVFVEIRDDPPGEDPDEIFSGWMFSAARAVSALEHPVYDLWLVECVDEVPQPPEDMARETVYSLPGNPPLPTPTPSRRL